MIKLTPMLEQYLSVKQMHKDAILLFRMGDFYEMFFEDAETASKALRITLTSRNRSEENPIPMCGVPHHAVAGYINSLIEQGFKVAVCDQVEDPRMAKGIVKREVTRVITPGTVIEPENLDAGSNNFLVSVAFEGDQYGLAAVDVSTGLFQAVSLEEERDLFSEISRIGPREIIYPKGFENRVNGEELEILTRSVYSSALDNERYLFASCYRTLTGHFEVDTLHGFGCEDQKEIVCAAGALLDYVKENQKAALAHVTGLTVYHLSEAMIIDEATRKNLELVESFVRKGIKGSLLDTLDFTETAMGARTLRHWICYPLVKTEQIGHRLQAVKELKEETVLREQLREEYGRISDLERLNGKVVLGQANARDLNALRDSLLRVPRLKELLAGVQSPLLCELNAGLDELADVCVLVGRALVDDPPVSLKEGGFIREGFNAELDRYISTSRDGKSWIAGLEAAERKRTSVNSLKVGFNKVFGYYIEVTRANLHLVPPDYVRKQTLANGERFITEDLKNYETLVLEAQEKRDSLEYELFVALREEVASHHKRMKGTAGAVGELDVLTALAHVADKFDYVRPEVNEGAELHILEGRHPVVERTLAANSFVPNDVHLDDEKEQVIIITGPNMSGKSTILRQVALIAVMAQMGSFVPAREARLCVFDRIFTRVGAMDDITRGHSTFMVEMIETSNIVHQATPRSLVILDEIGRGTSTFDGISIAWAVAEYLHDRRNRGVKTLFATHYHELTKLAQLKDRIVNYNVAVKEWNNRIIFLRRLLRGGASSSYGIEVARLAGLPKPIIKRAKEILQSLEKGKFEEVGVRETPAPAWDHRQMSLFGRDDGEIRKRLDQVDVNTITPLEALHILHDLKTLAGGGTIE